MWARVMHHASTAMASEITVSDSFQGPGVGNCTTERVCAKSGPPSSSTCRLFTIRPTVRYARRYYNGSAFIWLSNLKPHPSPAVTTTCRLPLYQGLLHFSPTERCEHARITWNIKNLEVSRLQPEFSSGLGISVGMHILSGSKLLNSSKQLKLPEALSGW
jgi:hypothetical protein